MKKLSIVSLLLLSALTLFAQKRLDISGTWQAEIVRSTGNERHDVKLPGSLLTNNLGDDVDVNTQWTGSLYDSSFYFNPYMAPYRQKGSMKFPFFLTSKKHFIGHVVYSRKVIIPKDWKKHTVILHLERPHIETKVSVNGVPVGHQMSLSVPHDYDVSTQIIAGKENVITIDVYNGIENVCVGQDSHSVTDQTQGNWNGIVGDMQLTAWPYDKKAEAMPVVRVFPNLSDGSVKVVVGKETFMLHVDNPVAWSEHSPKLYHRTVTYHGRQLPITFGFRDVTIKGRQFYINGQPIFLRGTVENCCFPLTGYAPTDVESWMKVIGKCKEYGLNCMRFHSFCPPEAAFVAADSLGFYLQPEGPSWPNHGVKLGRKMNIDSYLMDETKRICDTYGNHPSFVMMAAGNEPAGDWVRWCNQWVDTMKVYDPRHVYAGASVGGGWAWDSGSEFHVKGGARGLDWDRKAPHSDDDYYKDICVPRNFKPSASQPENTQPYVSHEQGQWCVFPDLTERSQYTGVYKAANFDIFADLLRDNGMESMSRKFLMSSGHLQTLAYKYEMERNLRTRDYAGFLLLGLNDYSGQGTALVGPLNVFWREKGYVDGATWRQFCNEVVPLAKFPKFVYQNDEALSVPMEVYNASGKSLEKARVRYSISYDDGKDGSISRKEYDLEEYDATIPVGKNNSMHDVKLQLGMFSSPTKVTLRASVGKYANTWDFWVYPSHVDLPVAKDIYIADTLDAKAKACLKKGGKVLLLAGGKVRYGNDVRHTYLPVFWNTSWFKMRPPHTTGSYIEKDHPMFGEFPTDDWQNLNWWELVNRTQVMNLSALPKEYQSPVQPIDTWHVSRKLGMVVEANVMGGKLFMTTLDIANNLDRRIVARQLRKSIIDYMQSERFNPSITLDAQTITDLFEKEAPAVNMFTKDSPDELKPKIK